MCYVNGRRIKDIGGIGEVFYGGTSVWRKCRFNRIVVVGDSSIGFSYSRDDGDTFATVPVGGANRNLKAVKRIGNEVFVAGDGGFVAKTSDLDGFASWTVMTGDSSLDYIDICAGNGKIVILAEGNRCSVGTASGPFSTVAMPGANLGPMAFGAGRFVSPSGSWGGNGAYSADGTSWTAVQLSAYKRYSPSGRAPEVYPCRNVCFGNGVFFCASGVWDGQSNHYEYRYSADGANWQTVQMTPGAGESFCLVEAALYFNGFFHALGARNVHKVDAADPGGGVTGRCLLWSMDNEKHSAFADGDLALLASSGRYGAVENKIAAYKGELNDGACLFAKTVPLSGTIREVMAI